MAEGPEKLELVGGIYGDNQIWEGPGKMEFAQSNMALYFRVNSATLWYGDSGFAPFVEAAASLLRLELKAEAGDFSDEEEDRRSEFADLLAGRPVMAFIHSHPAGQVQNEAGGFTKGGLTVCADTTDAWAEICAFLRKDSFDAVVSTLINGTRDLVSRCRVKVGIDSPPDKVDFSKRACPGNKTTFVIERFSIIFEFIRQDGDDTGIL